MRGGLLWEFGVFFPSSFKKLSYGVIGNTADFGSAVSGSSPDSSTFRKGGRVVDCGGLENRCAL